MPGGCLSPSLGAPEGPGWLHSPAFCRGAHGNWAGPRTAASPPPGAACPLSCTFFNQIKVSLFLPYPWLSGATFTSGSRGEACDEGAEHLARPHCQLTASSVPGAPCPSGDLQKRGTVKPEATWEEWPVSPSLCPSRTGVSARGLQALAEHGSEKVPTQARTVTP